MDFCNCIPGTTPFALATLQFACVFHVWVVKRYIPSLIHFAAKDFESEPLIASILASRP
jgi:hypothetical protein